MDRVVKTEYLKTKDVSERVNIAQSTVRKYCLELEKQGFVFQKDGDTRLFVASDVELFRGIDSMRKVENASLRHAVSIVLAHQKVSVTVENVYTPTTNELVSNDMTQVVAEIQQLRDAVVELAKDRDEWRERFNQLDQLRSDVAEIKEEVIQSRLITHASTEKTVFDRFLNLFKQKQRN